uniref:Translation initiation factor 5A C-terminal domain-containing protein n=1 Tax=Ustilago esculenta TaxID=185366 RepID=A0A481SH33_9BASI|nr:hypothetical protein UEMT_2017 [Ustilago esculenta]
MPVVFMYWHLFTRKPAWQWSVGTPESASSSQACFARNVVEHISASDDEQHNATFETADAGSSLTFPMQCSALRKNGHVVIKGRPCKIVDMSTSKTGKHGHAKVHLVAVDIFTTKKYEDISPSTHNMDVPNVQRNEFQLVNIDDGFLNLMTNEGDTKDDVRVPDGELGDQIQAAFDDGKDLMVTVVSAMGEEHCLSFKDAPQGK